LKNSGISLFLPSLSLIVDWRERDKMNSSGLECEACVVHFKVIKGESRWFRLKFVEVCEWFDGSDRLKIIFKSKKRRLPNCTLF